MPESWRSVCVDGSKKVVLFDRTFQRGIIIKVGYTQKMGDAMNIQRLTAFLMWCTIINGVLLVITAIMGTFGLDFVYSIHGKLFLFSRETLSVIFYLFLGLYKMVWLVFNAVPYVALLIIRKNYPPDQAKI